MTNITERMAVFFILVAFCESWERIGKVVPSNYFLIAGALSAFSYIFAFRFVAKYGAASRSKLIDDLVTIGGIDLAIQITFLYVRVLAYEFLSFVVIFNSIQPHYKALNYAIWLACLARNMVYIRNDSAIFYYGMNATRFSAVGHNIKLCAYAIALFILGEFLRNIDASMAGMTAIISPLPVMYRWLDAHRRGMTLIELERISAQEKIKKLEVTTTQQSLQLAELQAANDVLRNKYRPSDAITKAAGLLDRQTYSHILDLCLALASKPSNNFTFAQQHQAPSLHLVQPRNSANQ